MTHIRYLSKFHLMHLAHKPFLQWKIFYNRWLSTINLYRLYGYQLYIAFNFISLLVELLLSVLYRKYVHMTQFRYLWKISYFAVYTFHVWCISLLAIINILLYVIIKNKTLLTTLPSNLYNVQLHIFIKFMCISSLYSNTLLF